MNSLYILEVVETSFECLAASINQKTVIHLYHNNHYAD